MQKTSWMCETLKGNLHSYLGILRAAVAVDELPFPEGQHNQPYFRAVV